MMTRAVAAAAGFFWLASLVQAQDVRLELPLRCEMGRDCWIQQYVDRDPGPGLRDYACGSETYDGHDGTDIRIRDTEAVARGYAVVASAAGIVEAVRDGVADHLVRTDADRRLLASIECGNGVVIDHPNGWRTQYCHMRNGSIVVRPGEQVAAGQKLGDVGYSGLASFPHVHITVFDHGIPVDPFRPDSDPAGCGSAGALWSPETMARIPYVKGALLRLGFASRPLRLEALEEGRPADLSPSADWPAMVAFGWAIDLAAGDRISVTLQGPHGIAARNAIRLENNKAQYLLFAGKQRPQSGWPAGDYVARFAVTRGDEVLIDKHATARIE